MRPGERARPRAVVVRALVTLLAAVSVVGACGPAGPTPEPLPTEDRSFGPQPTGPVVTYDPPAPVTPEPTPGAAVVEDDRLLAILPPDLDGVPVTAERLAFAEAAADADFAANVEAAVFPIAVTATDLASGVVARLRPGVFGDAFYRDWRDTYDEGACGQAGGVTGRVETTLGGRTVHITSCAGGLRVYHAYLASRGTVVSLLSLGEARFGERLMQGLRP